MRRTSVFIKGVALLLLCGLSFAGCTPDSEIQQGKKQNTTNVNIRGAMFSSKPQTVTVDLSNYFDGFTGVAVFYLPSQKQFKIYNQDLAVTRRSPCSTFKIISSLVGLEKKVILPENSTRIWSGEVFWNDAWNQDIDFRDAFHSSCVWYFRQVIDEIGMDVMQEELEKLQYGNLDISDWEGRQNTNNNNRALTGFWIESSLKISPKEQTEVMYRIFGEQTVYQPKTIEQLKQVMLLPDSADMNIYGKTGTGKIDGITVDAWYTGFVEAQKETVYFCIYLGQTEGKAVSSAKAREIAIQIIADNIIEI